jgi:hypothetical protein
MIPYGYKLEEDGVSLAEAPEERETVARVQEMRSRGYSTRRIGKELLRQGIRPRCWTHWHPKVVMDLCRREAVSGRCRQERPHSQLGTGGVLDCRR